MNYTLRYANRKTICLKIDQNLEVLVIAPSHVSKAEIDKIVNSKQAWIEKAIEKTASKKNQKIEFSEAQISKLKRSAKSIILSKVAKYSYIMDVTPNLVRINSAKTKWASCSQNNNLNFSWRLILADEHLIDYVIIHELAHIKEHNHSDRFWKVVEQFYPEYKKARQELKVLAEKFY